MSEQWTTVLRGAPVLDETPSPGPSHRGPGLSGRVATVLHFAGRSAADAFGAVLVRRGRLVLHGLLVVPDGTEGATLRRLARWGELHPVENAAGPVPWYVVTLSAYFDPRATRERQPWAFTPCAYTGTGPVVGADLGAAFGTVAEHVVERRGANRGSWETWLPGWGYARPSKLSPGKVSRNRPPLRLRSRRVGWSVEFGPTERGHGKWTRQGPWRGEFVDLLSAAFTFDADRGAGYVEHARNFGVSADELPVVASLDADGARRLTGAVVSMHALALRLDAEAGRWFTSRADRDAGTHRLPLARLQSPAALGDHLLRRLRLARFDLSSAELAAWWESFHGGRVDDLPTLRGRPFGAVVLDVTSAYPLVAHLLGWWELVTADRLDRRTVTAKVHALCRRAAVDPRAVLEPGLWDDLGLTLVEVDADGDVLPVAVDDPGRPDGRTEVVPVTCRGRSLFYAWPDVLASVVATGKVPTIRDAVQLVPVGRQESLTRRVPVLPGLTLDADADPAVALVRRRRAAKRERDAALSACLHQVVNAAVSGTPSRLDDVVRKVGARWERVERNGPWTFAPLAATVTAGARLLLAVLDRLVRDAGSLVAYRDTDSSIVPASADGGTLDLDDGSSVRVLTLAEVETIRHAFDGLSPDPATWPVWKVTPGPGEPARRCIVFGPKRHVEYAGADDAPVLVDWTESGLGGQYADPAAMTGRCEQGGQAWSRAAVEREVVYAAARLVSPRAAVRDRAPWDAPGAVPFPTLRRLTVTSPAVGATLPTALDPRPGTRYLEAIAAGWTGRTETVHAVALDPGGDLAGWADLAWLDRTTGEPVRVTVDVADLSADAVVETLSARAALYGAPPRGRPVDAVTVTPLSVRYAGRVSPVLDAAEDGTPGPLADARVRYETAHGLGPGQYAELVGLARSLGPTRFAELTGVSHRIAGNLARGQLPRRATVRAVLARLRRTAPDPPAMTCACGCGSALPPERSKWLNDTHYERAKWHKRRERTARNGSQ